MAITEKNILMNNKRGNDVDILYPYTKIENVLDSENNPVSFAEKKKTWNVAIPITGWTSVAPYSIIIPVEGIKVGDEPNMYLIKSTNSETRKAQQEAFNKISDARTADSQIKIYCDEEVPTTAIEVKLEVVY